MSEQINPCKCGSQEYLNIEDNESSEHEYIEIHCKNCNQVIGVKYGYRFYATRQDAVDAAIYAWNKDNPIK